MSYCRFGEADVYVFLSIQGHLECCGCSLGDGWEFFTTDTLLEHLKQHREAGHIVPDFVFADLETDREKNDAWIKNIHASGLRLRFTRAYGNYPDHVVITGWRCVPKREVV